MPMLKIHKRAYKDKGPGGKYRGQYIVLPRFKGMRSINETVNPVLKRTQINLLGSKKHFIRERKFV